MNSNKFLGIITIITGILFVILPVFFKNSLYTVMGLSLICFGLLNLLKGIIMRKRIKNHFSNIFIAAGGIFLIIGFILIFNPQILSFLTGFEFYITGIVLIILGITGFLSNINHAHDLSAIITVIIGIISIALTVYHLSNPIHIAIITGFVLLSDGFAAFISEY